MTKVNAYSACSMKYGPDTINQLNECCYQTCAAFNDGSQHDIIKSECGQQCQRHLREAVQCKGKTECSLKLKVPTIKNHPKRFRTCLASSNDNTNDALTCCLRGCSSNACQQRCIDAYNALQEVNEPFLFRHNRVNRDALFLGFVIVMYLVMEYNIVSLPETRTDRLTVVISTLMVMFYLIQYLL